MNKFSRKTDENVVAQAKEILAQAEREKRRAERTDELPVENRKVDYLGRALYGALGGAALGGIGGAGLKYLDNMRHHGYHGSAPLDPLAYGLAGAGMGALGGALLGPLSGYVNEDVIVRQNKPNTLRRAVVGALIGAPYGGIMAHGASGYDKDAVIPGVLAGALLGGASGAFSGTANSDLFSQKTSNDRVYNFNTGDNMYFDKHFAKAASNFYGPKIVNYLLMQKRAADEPPYLIAEPKDNDPPYLLAKPEPEASPSKPGLSDLTKGTLIGGAAGIPVGLLAQAVLGKDKSLRAYLRSALLGGLGGAGLGAGVGLGAPAIQSYLKTRQQANNQQAVEEALGIAYPAGSKAIKDMFTPKPNFSPKPE